LYTSSIWYRHSVKGEWSSITKTFSGILSCHLLFFCWHNNILRINNIQCITLVVLYGQFMMHGQRNIKLCDAIQEYHYKNIKLKLYKNNATIWFNKTCRAKHLTSTYASIKIKGDNSRCQKMF